MKDLIQKGFRFTVGLYYFVYAQILFSVRYDRQYTRSLWYGFGEHGYRRIMRPGWKWAVNSYKGNKKLGVNQEVKWPVSPRCTVIIPENITFDPDDQNIFQSYGIYYQAFGRITIGKGTTIGPNVGLITANHLVSNVGRHDKAKEIRIGEGCWIGMNSVILPGVCLGNHVVVGAGSIVTKSFDEDNLVVAGNPARIIRRLENTGEKK
jgi:acetyltransferase-like isoleucine patch superfamily enzyme